MGFMVTVGAYAAAFPSGVTVKALAGSDYVMVLDGVDGAPSIGWTLTNGMIDGAKVTWKSDDSEEYNLRVTINTSSSQGTLNVDAVEGVERTDTVSLSPIIDPKDVNTVKIVIEED